MAAQKLSMVVDGAGAYDRGWYAQKVGISYWDNPYSENPNDHVDDGQRAVMMHVAWSLGWFDAWQKQEASIG